jgi:hypothetical protein
MGRKKREDREVVDESWTPVLRGKTYCSPACGCGCKKLDFDQATRDAARLVEGLEGAGWRADVWESVGWHFRAVSGPVQVYGDRLGRGGKLRYRCMISDRVDGTGGSMIWANAVPPADYEDPNEAVASVFMAAVVATSRVLVSLRRAAGAMGSQTLLRMSESVPSSTGEAGRVVVDVLGGGGVRRRRPN